MQDKLATYTRYGTEGQCRTSIEDKPPELSTLAQAVKKAMKPVTSPPQQQRKGETHAHRSVRPLLDRRST